MFTLEGKLHFHHSSEFGISAVGYRAYLPSKSLRNLTVSKLGRGI